MIWSILLLPLLFVVIGFILTEKNAPTLMSGYSSLTDEERAAYPLRESVRFFKRFHWSIGLIALLAGTTLFSVGKDDLAIQTVVLFPLIAYLYFMYRMIGFAPKRQRRMLQYLFVFMLIVNVGIGVLFSYSDQPNTLELRDSVMIIHGMYGVTLPKEQISSIQLTDTFPATRFKTNGYATGDVRKGHFRTRDGRTVRLLLTDRTTTMLYIKLTEGKDIYYQSPDESPEVVYEKLNNWLNP